MTGEFVVEEPLIAGLPDDEVAAPWSAWFALAVLVIATLFGFVDRQVISLLAEPIRHALNLSDSRLGIIQGLGFAVFTVALSFPIGWLTDRYDRRVVLAGCVLVWAAATAACGLAHNFLQLFLATIGIAAGEAGLSPIIYSVLPDLFSYRQRVTANLIFYISSILGIALGFGLGGAAIGALTALHPHLPLWLQEWEPWRLAFFAVSLPGPLLVVLIAILRLPRRHGAKTMATPAGFPAFSQYIRENLVSIVTVIGSMGVYSFAYGATLTWLPVVLVRVFKMTPAFSGGALGGIIGIGTLAGVAIAAIAMRFVVPRLGKAAPVRIGRMAMLAGAVPAALIFFASTWWQLLALGLLQTIAGVTAGSLTPNMIQDLSPARFRARMAAVMAMITGPVGGSSVIVVGIVSDTFFRHEQRGLILAIATVALPGWLLAFALMRLAERPFTRTVQAITASGDD